MAVATLARRPLCDGRAALVELGPAPANILTREAIAALREELAAVAADAPLRALVIAGSGPHFSYGASVPEHMPGVVERMLPEFHALLRDLNDLPLPPVIAAVRGRCLGGGFELALCCDVLAVAADAELGCPEIRLGVFPPAGAALLPLRAPAGRAASMLLSGATIRGSEASAAGIADLEAAAGELLQRVEDWVREHLLPLSAAALRHARRALRWRQREALDRALPRLERQYLQELMQTRDALEGLLAFQEKRRPKWEDR